MVRQIALGFAILMGVTPALAADANLEVSIERVEKRSSLVIRVRNLLPTPIHFFGHSPTSPQYRIRTRIDERPWREHLVGTCGTGLERRVLAGKAEFTFNVSLPRWVEIAPETTGVQVGVSYGGLSSDTVAWGEPVDVPPLVLEPGASPDIHQGRMPQVVAGDGEYRTEFPTPCSPCAELASYLLQSRDAVNGIKELVLEKYGSEWRTRLTDICNSNLGEVDLLESAMIAYSRHCADVRFHELGAIGDIRLRCTSAGIE